MPPLGKDTIEYYVFVASPSDTSDERQRVRDFFAKYTTRAISANKHVRFQVIDWENYSTAGVGRPQQLITRDTLERFKDSLVCVIGILNMRFGLPTGDHESGTEEEFYWALGHYIETGWPQIKWFFHDSKDFHVASSDSTVIGEALQQYEKVCAFRRKVQDDPRARLLYKQYPNLTGFERALEDDLYQWLDAPGRPWNRAAEPSTAPVAGRIRVRADGHDNIPPESLAEVFQHINTFISAWNRFLVSQGESGLIIESQDGGSTPPESQGDSP